MKGLDVYKTKDGFTVARLHYTADPEKDPTRDGKEWFEGALRGTPGGILGAAWRKEMEIDFTAYSGQLLCYDQLVTRRNEIVKHYKVKDYYFKYGSLDWGRNNPCAFTEYVVGEDKHIHANYEIYQNGISVPEFCDLIKKAPHYHEYMWITADPSLWNRNQETKEGLRSLSDMFHENGVYIIKGKSRDDSLAIEELLTRWGTDEVSFTIEPKCYKQVWEFERLRYKEITTAMMEKSNPHEQLVDKDNHSWDDFKYFISTWLREPTHIQSRIIKKHSLEEYIEQDQNLGKGTDWRAKYKE